MSKRQTNEENKELEMLRKEILELRERVYKNFCREMLKYWGIHILFIVGGIFLAFLAIGIASRFITLPHPDVDLSKVGEIASNIFTVSVAVGGVIIGFVPLCSFFYLREIGESRHELEQDLEKQKKKSKGEKRKLIETIDTYWFVVWNNLRSGILGYTKTYLSVSIFLQIILMEFYVMAIVQEIAPLYIIADFIALMIIITGIFPLINVALYHPPLRPVRVIVVEREFTRFVPND